MDGVGMMSHLKSEMEEEEEIMGTGNLVYSRWRFFGEGREDGRRGCWS